MSECRALRFRFQPRKEISFEDWQVQHRTNSSLVLADVIWCGATNYVVVQLAHATNINAKLSEEKTNESSAATNLIDIVIKRLNSSNGLWMNGGCPILDLSSNATPQEVVSQAVGKWSLNDGKINNYRIVEARKIDLRYRAGCYAALIDSNLGKKILLFEYIGGARGNWWTRFIDAP
jgi:hypothetical protein